MTIDIHSKADFPAAALSNLAAHRFEVDGVVCASMEGLLQSLKFTDPADQARVRGLSGVAAKKAGRDGAGWMATGMLSWAGSPLDRRSTGYQELLERAYDSLAGNDAFARALRATGAEPLAHTIGGDDPASTILTAAEFCGQLVRVRSALPPADAPRLDGRRLVKVSKYLAKHLRHRPDRLGLDLDEAGWVDVSALLDACARSQFPVSRAELGVVVADNDKRRYEIAVRDGVEVIRAVQGHSVEVVLDHAAAAPPAVLFHGTVGRFLDAIFTDGLTPQGRHDVHLSADVATARSVGARRGRPVVLSVDAAAMATEGVEFRVAPNGVWLVPHVPADHLRVVG